MLEMIYWIVIVGLAFPLLFYILTVKKERDIYSRRLGEIQRRLKEIEEASSKKDEPDEGG